MQKPKIICVTGGKGGTGKTLVAVNLATMFSNNNFKVLLVDGDVENPNTYLLMNGKLENKRTVTFFKPNIDEEQCSRCGLCAQNCAPHALLFLNDSVPIPILTMCSGCKLCYKICPTEAIIADLKDVGSIYSTVKNKISLLIGELKPSEARSATIVEALIEELNNLENDSFDIIILDTAPGAHCDVEHLISKADYVIPVTEPTRFGNLDLHRIIELIELLGKDYQVIVNRSSLLGFREAFLNNLKKEKIKILGDIPLDKEIVKSYCQGVPLMVKNNNGKGYLSFELIFDNLLDWINS